MSRKEPRSSLLAMFVLGTCFGAPALLFGFWNAANHVTLAASTLAIALAVGVLNACIVIYFRKEIWSYLGAGWVAILASIERATVCAKEGDTSGAITNSFEAAKRVIGKFVWGLFIATCVAMCLAVVAAFGFVLQSALVFKQNELIAEQTKFFKGQELHRQNAEDIAINRELRRRLDTILATNVEGHIFAEVGATLGQLLDFELGYVPYDENLVDDLSGASDSYVHDAKVAMHGSDTRVYLLLMLKNQISMERATGIIEELEQRDASLLSVADYAAVSNGLLASGQLSLAEEYAFKGLNRSDESVVDIYLNLQVARIQYADGREGDASASIDTTIAAIKSRECSRVEKRGFISQVLATKAHSLLAANEQEKANETMDEVRKLVANLPDVDRGIRWRTQHLIDSFDHRVAAQNSRAESGKSVAPSNDDSTLKWKYLNQLKMPRWLERIDSEEKLRRHAKAYVEAKKEIDKIEQDALVPPVSLQQPDFEGGPGPAPVD